MDGSDGVVSLSVCVTYDLHVCVLWCLANYCFPTSLLQLGQTTCSKHINISCVCFSS